MSGADPFGLMPRPTISPQMLGVAWDWLWGDSSGAIRTRGAMGLAGGALEIYGGISMIVGGALGSAPTAGSSLVITAGGFIVVLHGFDYVAHSWIQVLTGAQQTTLSYRYLERLLGPQAVEVIDLIIGLGGMLKGAFTLSRGVVNALKARRLRIKDASSKQEAIIDWGGCFLAGTLAWTAHGAVPIEQVEPGTEVWSYDHGFAEWRLVPVETTSERLLDGALIEILLAMETGAMLWGTDRPVVVTPEHPFWVIEGPELDSRPIAAGLSPAEHAASPGGRWIEAKWLRLGDRLLTRTGASATVAGLTIRLERVKVYNLEVAELERYAVDQAGVLVHNASCFNRDHIALQQIVNEATRRGRIDLSRENAKTIMQWAKESKYPGFRASLADLLGGHWVRPHINLPQCGRGGHVPVAPGVTPP